MTISTQSENGVANRTRQGSTPENPEGFDSVDIQEEIFFSFEEHGPMTSKELKEDMLSKGFDPKDTRTHLDVLRSEGEVERVINGNGAFYRLPHQDLKEEQQAENSGVSQ